MDWFDAVGMFLGGLLVAVFIALFVLIGFAIKAAVYDVPIIQSKYSAVYDVDDVGVFLEAIDCDWDDFDRSVTLRRTYENVRDGKESLGEIKKKKNETAYVPIIMPIGR